ncbi:hypothetical protein QY887_01790 [Latilactobacillus sakei]
MSLQSKHFIQALKNGVVPATGCTEPIAVAFGAATCMAQLTNREIQAIEVHVSPNVMKNALAVMVPGTGEPGLLVARGRGGNCSVTRRLASALLKAFALQTYQPF